MASWWSPPVDLMVCVRELQEQLIDKDIHDVPRRLPLEPQDILLHNQPSSLVGHKRRMEEVIDLLMNSKDMAKLKIISIVGMVGSGKTTLAAAVYQRVSEHYDCCAFVYMGQQCDTVETLKGMLRQLEMKDQESMDIFDLKWMLREFLRDKRYLIMFDDLWSSQHWDIIQSCFPQNGPDSKIIITTTDDAVALHCSLGLSDWIYKIDLLSDVDSEQLFLNQVCGTGKGFPQHFKDHSAEIMKKCGGLPLAIVSVAAMLEHNQSEDGWRRIGLKSLSSSDKNYMWQRLNLKYNDLPHILKTCMMYLSIFPVYYEVDVERLAKLWIAEGLIAEGFIYETLEETARSCLDGLISRNMVLPLHVNQHGIPKRCMVHPVIHDFTVSRSREENFVAIVNDQHQDKTNTGTIRRLSLQSSSERDREVPQNTSMDLSRVRSIIAIGQACTVPDLAGLRLVRILDLEGCDVTTLCLDHLHKLQLLRYLSLRGTNVSVLPDTIGELRYLQTLDVRSTSVKELPLSIFRLQELMHLLCGSAKLPPIIKRMEMLQTLSYATHRSTILWELRKIVNLKQLELFLDFTQMPHDRKQVSLNHGGFRSLKKLCIRCNSASVAFEPDVLTRVEVLELSFQGPLVNEASAVSGIEHLRSLKHVLLEFSQGDAGAMATVNAVKEAATTLRRSNPEVTVTVDWRPLGSTST